MAEETKELWVSINDLKEAGAATNQNLATLTTDVKNLTNIVGSLAQTMQSYGRTNWPTIIAAISVTIIIGGLVLRPLYDQQTETSILLKETRQRLYDTELKLQYTINETEHNIRSIEKHEGVMLDYMIHKGAYEQKMLAVDKKLEELNLAEIVSRVETHLNVP